jgi:cell division septum initiation protein DivIVA
VHDARETVARGTDRRPFSAADRVASIVSAAEDAADHIREEAETKVRDRIAEGDRAAEYRIHAAEEEAAEILAAARADAERMVREAETYTRELLSAARLTAQDVRTEGLEVVANLRQMGDSLRANSERLLRDVQAVHSQMVARIERVEAGVTSSPADSRQAGSNGHGSGELPDVPEFIPRR